MEECEFSPRGRDHSLKPASMKRMAWAQSRDSFAPSQESEKSPEELLPTQSTSDKPSPAETGPIPNKIASWLQECRTPLGASLDDQSSCPSRGPVRNGCSFEDDLSLGAEANHLQSSGTKPGDTGYSMPAKDKRSQFKQKGRSMNSTGSGKSSGTVSSVSELLDLYEEDPEEILYNLGFGREEPDIASKIPSRFFNASSGAKGIDIKVYLGAQMQRMELENPNYALTSRFRQTEVLAKVANVFSEIYCNVSGRPLQKIGAKEAEPKEPINSAALNAAKILKKSLTRPNILNPSEGESGQIGATPDPEGHSDSENKLPKVFKKKDSASPLATVTEETLQVCVNAAVNKTAVSKGNSAEVRPNFAVNSKDVTEPNDGAQAGETDSGEVTERQKTEKYPSFSLLTNPHNTHLLRQQPDSFEMEELQSNEDEVLPMSRPGSEHLLRTASQQSDSSGFAEDPSTDGSANSLKVQESSDSCDSENTVTSHAGDGSTPLALEHPAFEKLQDEMTLPGGANSVLKYTAHQLPRLNDTDETITEMESSTEESDLQILSDRLPSPVMDANSSVESSSTVTIDSGDSDFVVDSVLTGESVDMTHENNVDSFKTVVNLSLPSNSSMTLNPTDELDSSFKSEPSPKEVDPMCQMGRDHIRTTSEKVRNALIRAEQRSSSVCDDRVGRAWIRRKDLLRDNTDETRNPLRRSSSLPTSLLSPTRVVSSVRIQLGGGSVRHCTPPAYSYKYEEERERDEIDSIAETDEHSEDVQSRCRSTLLIKQVSTESEQFRSPPYPLNVPPHLTRSASSLYSVPADFPLRRVAQGAVWSANSFPDLTNPTMPHAQLPQQNQHHLPHYRGGINSPFYPNKPGNYPSHGAVSSPLAQGQSPMYTPYTPAQDSFLPQSLHPSLHGVPYPQTNAPYSQVQNAPYGPSAPFHSPFNHPPPHLSGPYGSTFNLQGNPYNHYSPLAHSHSAPNSLFPGAAPFHPHLPYGHNCSSPFSQSPAPFPCDLTNTPPAMSSTEMQLRRVLHEIRDTVHGLSRSPSFQRDGPPLGTRSPHQASQPLYEELQMRRRSLNVFRSQMMDLELSLMRQQSMVYQDFNSDERREVEQLQRLRSAVRQELQELELQLEDRLLSLSDQLRSAQHSRLCHHPLGLSRGHSMDSLSTSSALRAMEPVTDLLREQLYLQSELGYEESLSAAGTPVSGHSSRAESPSRSTRNSEQCSPAPQKGGVYRTTVCITPSVPPRPELGQSPPGERQENISPNLNPDSSERERPQRAGLHHSPQEDQSSSDREDIRVQEDRGGGGGKGHLEQLIQQIKQSLAEEIRQELVNELLAAVSPRRSPVSSREPPS
ncbi:protein ITPRID2 [Hoplias malabaricus]|uniref:protein ITPRID2 n=1 Tax=Hoplias malabaricus TaxID=27720 RepID=UPI003461E5E3